MDLWIRSQDKDSLIKVEKIELIYDCLCSDDIQLIHIETDKGIIGSYSTKERALEVLDEIQNILQPPANFIVSQHIDFADAKEGLIGVNVLKEEPKIERISDIIVYQMPLE